MIDATLESLDRTGNPMPPCLSPEEDEAWILGEILPVLRAAGELTDDELSKDLERTEGFMTDSIRL